MAMGADCKARNQLEAIMDLVFVLISLAFFGLTWGLVLLCERLMEQPS